MAKPNGDRDPGHQMEGVCLIALLLLRLLSDLQGGQIAYMRGRELDESWNDPGDALAMPSGDLQMYPSIDPEGQYNVPLVGQQLQVIQDPIMVEDIDADNAAAAEADLAMLLAVAEVASLPRQIERDEANIMMVRRPPVLSSVTESDVAPSSLSLVDDVAAGAPQHLPPQASVPETVAADVEVATEAFPSVMLELSSGSRHPQFATPSMAVPEGDLESNLEEFMLVERPETGDSSADQEAKINIQDDVENSEVGEPHAKGMH